MTWAIGQHPNISLQPETDWMPGLMTGIREAYKVGTARGSFSQLGNCEMPFEAFAAHFGTAIDAVSRDCFERRIASFASG